MICIMFRKQIIYFFYRYLYDNFFRTCKMIKRFIIKDSKYTKSTIRRMNMKSILINDTRSMINNRIKLFKKLFTWRYT